MSDETSPDRDLRWYRSQWDDLMALLDVSDPKAVVAEVRRLQERLESMKTQQDALSDLGVSDPERALRMIENMADQLEELYAERDHRAGGNESRPNT